MVERPNVGDRLKRVLAKFQVNRSHPQGVNGRSEISKKSHIFRLLGRRKMKRRGSSETRFGQV